jgi:hypothetical protein
MADIPDYVPGFQTTLRQYYAMKLLFDEYNDSGSAEIMMQHLYSRHERMVDVVSEMTAKLAAVMRRTGVRELWLLNKIVHHPGFATPDGVSESQAKDSAKRATDFMNFDDFANCALTTEEVSFSVQTTTNQFQKTLNDEIDVLVRHLNELLNDSSDLEDDGSAVTVKNITEVQNVPPSIDSEKRQRKKQRKDFSKVRRRLFEDEDEDDEIELSSLLVSRLLDNHDSKEEVLDRRVSLSDSANIIKQKTLELYDGKVRYEKIAQFRNDNNNDNILSSSGRPRTLSAQCIFYVGEYTDVRNISCTDGNAAPWVDEIERGSNGVRNRQKSKQLVTHTGGGPRTPVTTPRLVRTKEDGSPPVQSIPGGQFVPIEDTRETPMSPAAERVLPGLSPTFVDMSGLLSKDESNRSVSVDAEHKQMLDDMIFGDALAIYPFVSNASLQMRKNKVRQRFRASTPTEGIAGVPYFERVALDSLPLSYATDAFSRIAWPERTTAPESFVVSHPEFSKRNTGAKDPFDTNTEAERRRRSEWQSKRALHASLTSGKEDVDQTFVLTDSARRYTAERDMFKYLMPFYPRLLEEEGGSEEENIPSMQNLYVRFCILHTLLQCFKTT